MEDLRENRGFCAETPGWMDLPPPDFPGFPKSGNNAVETGRKEKCALQFDIIFIYYVTL